MTNVEALKNLYVALGGSADDAANIVTISDMITAITTQVTTAGIATKELPAVSADDNGKVLKVVNGAWAVGTDATE